MNTTYPYDTIQINGRTILIQDIRSGATLPQSGFEASTYAFIRDWYSGAELFTQPTSGSTGNPREITITRAGMIASAGMTQRAVGLQAGWQALVCLNTAYIAGKMMLARSFVTGMKIIAVEPSGNPFIALTPDQPIDFTALVPLQIHDLIRSEKSTWFNRINTILVGGAALDPETRKMLQQYPCRFFATYGMTETISHIALMPLNGPSQSEYFTVLPGIITGLDERGCLTIQGSYLAEKIITNDLVERVDEFNFRWLGRWDNIINTGGIKVIPEKLETEIQKIFSRLGVHQNFFVSSVPDNRLENKVVLIVEHEISEDLRVRLNEEMLTTITRHEIPKHIFSARSFIFTASGKIDRNATREQINVNNYLK